jgi:hypothetical protein
MSRLSIPLAADDISALARALRGQLTTVDHLPGQSSQSACCSMVSAFARISADRAARMLVIARALPSSWVRALRSPPTEAWGGASAPSGHPNAEKSDRQSGPARSPRNLASIHEETFQVARDQICTVLLFSDPKMLRD